jgi:hypothetical protein
MAKMAKANQLAAEDKRVERSFFKAADRTQKIEAKSRRSIGVGHANLPVIGITNMDRRVVVPDVYRRVLHLSLCLSSVSPIALS